MDQTRSIRGVLWVTIFALILAVGNSGGEESVSRPGDPVYQALRQVTSLDRIIAAQNVRLRRDAAELVFEQGELRFAAPVNDRNWLAVFSGKGLLRLTPSTVIERDHLRLLTKKQSLDVFEERFKSAVLIWADGTFEELAGAGAPQSSPAGDEAMKSLRKFQELMREKLRWNLELRILPDMYNPPKTGMFVAFVQGDEHSKLLYVLDPRGASVALAGTEESGLLNGDEDQIGWWYLSHTKDELAAAGAAHEDRAAFETIQYSIDCTVDKSESINATARIRVRIKEDGARVLAFSLAPKLAIRKVTLLPDQTPVQWIKEGEKEGDDFGIVLPRPASKDEEIELEVQYGGKDIIVDTGEGNYFVGWRTSWYPSVPKMVDYATFELEFRVPKGHDVVAVGDLVRRWTEGEQECSEWRTPVPVLVAGFNYGKFAKLEQKDPKTGVTVEVYTNPGTPNFIKEIESYMQAAERPNIGAMMDPDGVNYMVMNQSIGKWDTTALAQYTLANALFSMRLYSHYFGPLPFTRIAISQQPPAFFGQAWPTLVYLPFTAFMGGYQRQVMGLGGAGFSRGFIQVVGQHEVAHQWWGHLVGHGSYRDEWLSEGLAEFSSSLALEKSAGLKRAREFWKTSRIEISNNPRAEVDPYKAGPISLGSRLETQRTGGAYGAIVYGKGAYIVHMLRMMMQGPHGQDDAFVAMMKDFTTHNAGRACSTADFKAAVERHMTKEMDVDGNQRMDWFFGEWLDGTEIPSYELQARLDPTGKGQLRLTGSLRQQGVSENFRMIVPIYIDLGSDQIVRIGRIRCAGSTAVPLDVTLPIAKAAGVLVNANYDVLSLE
ncbi:MAG: M1 family aminopeptidase [Acidobacteriota bacterium]